MIFLLEIKEKWLKFYYENEKKVLVVFKFITALLFLILINYNVGFWSILSNPLLVIGASVVCAFTPKVVMIFVLTFFWLGHSFYISPSLGTAILIILIIMYLLYFRFCPKAVYVLLLTVLCCLLQIPFALPIILALAFPLSYVFAIDMGIVIYYIMNTERMYLNSLTFDFLQVDAKAITYIFEMFSRNNNMIMVLIVMTATFLTVGIIRKCSSFSWIYSSVVGIIAQLALFVITKIIFKSDISVASIIVGSIVGIASLIIYNSMAHNVDYSKAENVEFEDDEFFYYVKAVPKRNVTVSNVKVTRINVKNVYDNNESDKDSDQDNKAGQQPEDKQF